MYKNTRCSKIKNVSYKFFCLLHMVKLLAENIKSGKRSFTEIIHRRNQRRCKHRHFLLVSSSQILPRFHCIHLFFVDVLEQLMALTVFYNVKLHFTLFQDLSKKLKNAVKMWINSSNAQVNLRRGRLTQNR